MSAQNTGGPAFPGPYVNDKGGLESIWKQGGMTLRDYFAAKAMQGFIAATREQLIESDVALITRSSYILADAMLKARQA